MSDPENIFPLKLSDFEYYAFRDETPEYPMVMILKTHLEGALDVRAFQESLNEALHDHPLLRSTIVRRGRELFWNLVPNCSPALTCTHYSGDDPPQSCPAVTIDLTTTAGAVFDLRVCPGRSVLVSYLHHACVDGAGGIQFLADVFARYGTRTAATNDEQPEVQHPDPSILPTRGRIPQMNRGHKTWSEWVRGPLRFLLGRNFCIPPRCRESKSQSIDTEKNVLHTGVLDKSVVRKLKRLAAINQVSTNDLCMMVYLQQLAAWTQSHSRAKQDDLFRILMPVSMRTPEHDCISAANVLSYVFQPFRRHECGQPVRLLKAIHERSSEMMNENEGAVLLRLFALVRRVPGLYQISQRLQPSFATAVLACVGELKRIFGNRFPLRKGRVVAGNVIIQRIDGIAPLRKNTNIVISFGGYAGELILNLRANPEVVTADEAQIFLKQIISRLTKLAENQSVSATCDALESVAGGRRTDVPVVSQPESVEVEGVLQ